MHTSCRALPCALAFNRLSLHPLGTAPVSPGQMGSREMAHARKAAGSPQAAQTGARGLELPACPDPCGSPATRGHSAPPTVRWFQTWRHLPPHLLYPSGVWPGQGTRSPGDGRGGRSSGTQQAPLLAWHRLGTGHYPKRQRAGGPGQEMAPCPASAPRVPSSEAGPLSFPGGPPGGSRYRGWALGPGEESGRTCLPRPTPHGAPAGPRGSREALGAACRPLSHRRQRVTQSGLGVAGDLSQC